MNLEDTIVAISSPPGKAVRGIVRLSGPDALRIAGRLFKTESRTSTDPAASDETDRAAESCPLLGDFSLSPVGEGAGRYIHQTPPRGNLRSAGHITLNGSPLPASVYVFCAPHSYTRQDVVELHMLGSPVLLGWVVKVCLEAGARRAEAGEFTARAYLAGAMDISCVHGIAGLIAARSDQQLRAAERLLHGSLSETARRSREELADLLSLVEGALDFADEPIEFITPQALRERLTLVRTALDSTMNAALRTERWDRLPHVVLSGRPNAGKSSMFNRLTGMDRSICAPIAGTTRDAISAPMVAGGIECLLIDAPGLMDRPSGLDARAVEQARAALKNADLILEIVDAASDAGPGGIHSHDAPVIRVGNKSDLLGTVSGTAALIDGGTGFLARTLRPSHHRPTFNIFASALTGEGCEELMGLIAMFLHGREADVHDSAIAMMAEHRDALAESVDSLDRALQLAQQSQDTLGNADLVALELHAAADSLAILVGQDQTEEMLGRIFSRFCVGK